jgi:hypothetical protein
MRQDALLSKCIPQVISEHEELWWDADRGKLLILPPELWKSYQQSYSSEAGGTGEGNDGFCLSKYFFHNFKGF